MTAIQASGKSDFDQRQSQSPNFYREAAVSSSDHFPITATAHRSKLQRSTSKSFETNVIPIRRDYTEQQQEQVQRLQNRVRHSEATIDAMHGQIQYLKNQLVQANIQSQFAQNAAATVSEKAEKSRGLEQTSTYVVPRRMRSTRFDRIAETIPFSILMVLFGVGLTVAIAAAIPSTAFWLSLSPLIITIVRGAFIVIAFSTAIFFTFEIGNQSST